MIPTTMSKPKKEFQEFSTLLYGAPKVGKSTLAAQFDHPLFIDTEGGLNALEVYLSPVGTWEEFKALYEEIRTAMRKGEFPFKTLVFDTVDNLKLMCSKYMCENVLKVTHESDLDYGKGWSTVKKEFAMVMAAYKSLGLGRIYISHADSKEIKTRVGSYTRWNHTMDNQAKDIIEPEVDFIFFAEVIKDQNGERRVLHTKPADTWVAGDRTGRLPAEIPMTYEAIITEFAKATDPNTPMYEGLSKNFSGASAMDAEPTKPEPRTPPVTPRSGPGPSTGTTRVSPTRVSPTTTQGRPQAAQATMNTKEGN